MKYGVPISQIPKARRSCFIADEGYMLVGGDVKAAESHIVSYMSGDEGYIAAHEGEWDTHTLVAKMGLPDLQWPGDDPVACRSFCEDYTTNKGKSLRNVFKGVQHASNYLGTPHTIARQVGITVAEAEEFQSGYFTAFPGIPEWHQFLKAQIKREKCIVYPGFGFVRETFERPWAEDTARQLVAALPQGFLALYVHKALLDCWRMLAGVDCCFLIHGHDQLVFQVREDKAEWYRDRILELMEWEVEVEDPRGKQRALTLRTDIHIGPNWKVV